MLYQCLYSLVFTNLFTGKESSPNCPEQRGGKRSGPSGDFGLQKKKKKLIILSIEGKSLGKSEDQRSNLGTQKSSDS